MSKQNFIDQEPEYEDNCEGMEATHSPEEDVDSHEEDNHNASDKSKKHKKQDKKIAALEEEKEALNDKYLRLYSEFDNYRRRTAKERLDLTKTATESLIKELLPVLDDFDRALENIPAEDERTTELRNGVELIHHKLLYVLGQKGLKQIEVGTGSDFDTDYQEAVTLIPAPTDDLKGKVIDVIEKGYMLNDTIIRFTKVVVGA